VVGFQTLPPLVPVEWRSKNLVVATGAGFAAALAVNDGG
jgi:hypothetical protein